jgi:hypothetical protein
MALDPGILCLGHNPSYPAVIGLTQLESRQGGSLCVPGDRANKLSWPIPIPS